MPQFRGEEWPACQINPLALYGGVQRLLVSRHGLDVAERVPVAVGVFGQAAQNPAAGLVFGPDRCRLTGPRRALAQHGVRQGKRLGLEPGVEHRLEQARDSPANGRNRARLDFWFVTFGQSGKAVLNDIISPCRCVADSCDSADSRRWRTVSTSLPSTTRLNGSPCPSMSRWESGRGRRRLRWSADAGAWPRSPLPADL